MLDIITRLIWIYNYARATFSKSCVSILEKNSESSLSPWHQNDIVFITYGMVYPRQGLLGYPLLGLYFLGMGLVIRTSWPPIQSPISFFAFFFHCSHPSPSFYHIFKITFKYIKSSHFQSLLLQSTISFIMTCLNTRMFKNNLKATCMYGMNVSFKTIRMYGMSVNSAVHDICIHYLLTYGVSANRCRP